MNPRTNQRHEQPAGDFSPEAECDLTESGNPHFIAYCNLPAAACYLLPRPTSHLKFVVVCNVYQASSNLTVKMNIKPYSPGQGRYSARIKNEEWEPYRQKLTLLHSMNVPRRQMLEILDREDDFRPSLPQLNARFNTWGLRRYDKSVSKSGATAEDSSPDRNSGQQNSHPQSINIMANHKSRVGGNEDQNRQTPSIIHEDISFDNLSGEESSENGIIIMTPDSSPNSRSHASSASHVSLSGTPDRNESVSLAVRNAHSTFDPACVVSSDTHGSRLHATSSRLRVSSPYAIHAMKTPTDLLVTDKLLRGLNEYTLLISNNRQKRTQAFETGRMSDHQANEIRRLQIRTGINSTAQAYENAHYFLKLGEPGKAIQRLQDASSTAPLLFEEPDLFLLTRVIEIATWSSWKKFPEYEPFVFKYLAAESGKKLGQQHPLTHLLAGFAQAAAISTSYPTLWTCIIERIDELADDQVSRSESQQIRIKAYFYLVRVLRNNSNYFAAVERCKELIQLCITVDGIRSFSANRARYNLAVNHCEAGNLDDAMEAYEEAEKYLGTMNCPNDGWIFAVFATNERAQLYEQKGNIEKAGECYEQALVRFLQFGGDESSGAILMLKDLVDFHGRHDNEGELSCVRKQYPACYAALISGVLDNPQHWVGRRVTTQASGGKSNRAWTWTSPIT